MKTPESEIARGEREDPEEFEKMMSKFSAAEYRLISATLRRAADFIEDMDTVEQAVSYCRGMSEMTRVMADKKEARAEEQHKALPPAPMPSDGLLDAWRNSAGEKK